jgi:ribosome maturation factor RimP
MVPMDLNQRESLEARIISLAEQAAASMGMEVVLVEIKGGGNRSIVRTFIDQPGGISLNDCERFSKRFSVLLDVEDWIPFSYVLEVSSPGLDRPLVKEGDFRRFVGREVRMRTRVPAAGQRNFRGRILSVTEGRLMLELAEGKNIEIVLTDVEKANLVAEI